MKEGVGGHLLPQGGPQFISLAVISHEYKPTTSVSLQPARVGLPLEASVDPLLHVSWAGRDSQQGSAAPLTCSRSEQDG